MRIRASLKDIPLSAQKGRLVADMVRHQPVTQALDILLFTQKKGARIIHKLLESAIANAENEHSADIDELKVKEIMVDEAQTLKRIKPRAKGRANRISKRKSHITIVLMGEE